MTFRVLAEKRKQRRGFSEDDSEELESGYETNKESGCYRKKYPKRYISMLFILLSGLTSRK